MTVQRERSAELTSKYGFSVIARARDDGADVVHPRGDGGELLEVGARALRDYSRDRRLPGAWRAEQDHRRRPVLFDREPQCGARSQHVLLPDEVVELGGTQAHGERRALGLTLSGCLGEEVGHVESMLAPR
jgi:hypothetical protein